MNRLKSFHKKTQSQQIQSLQESPSRSYQSREFFFPTTASQSPTVKNNKSELVKRKALLLLKKSSFHRVTGSPTTINTVKKHYKTLSYPYQPSSQTTNLSTLTIKANASVTNELSKLAQCGQSEEDELCDNDVGKQLQWTKTEIKILSYNLRRSLQGQSSHIEVRDNINAEIQLMAKIPIYCKISMAMQIAPLQIQFIYKAQTYEVLVMLSTTHQKPSEQENLIKKYNPAQMVFGNKISNKPFAQPTLYMTLLSEDNCVVVVNAQFNKIKQQSRNHQLLVTDTEDLGEQFRVRSVVHSLAEKRKLIQEEIQQALHNPYYKEALIDNYKQLIRNRQNKSEVKQKKLQFAEGTSFRQKSSPYFHSRSHSEDLLRRTALVQERKQLIELTKHNKNSFNLVKRQYYKTQKLLQERLQAVREQRNSFSRQWEGQVKVSQIMVALSNNFIIRRFQVLRQKKQEKMIRRLKEYLTKNFTGEGCIKKRHSRYIYNLFKFSHQMTKGVLEFKAEKIVYNYLSMFATQKVFVSRVRDFYQKITYIQQKFRNAMQINRAQLQLLKQCWSAEVIRILKQTFASKKQTKHIKRFIEDLNQIPESTKEQLLQQFIRLQKLRYYAKIVHWKQYSHGSKNLLREGFQSQLDEIREQITKMEEAILSTENDPLKYAQYVLKVSLSPSVQMKRNINLQNLHRQAGMKRHSLLLLKKPIMRVIPNSQEIQVLILTAMNESDALKLL